MKLFVIVLDCLRKDHVGAYNEQVDFTPNIDNFAEENRHSDFVVSQAPWTLPSHVSMLTGRYPWDHGATQRNLQVPESENMIQEDLKENGFATGLFSENGFLKPHTGITRGFDKILPKSNGMIDTIVGRAESFFASDDRSIFSKKILELSDRLYHWRGKSKTEELLSESLKFADGNQDCLAFINLMDAHEPYFPPKDIRERFDAPQGRKVDQTPQQFYGSRKPDKEALQSLYRASVSNLDRKLGKFLESLKSRHYYSESLVVITSDHGQVFNDSFYGHQFSVSDELVEVPFLYKLPDKKSFEGSIRELKDLESFLSHVAEGEDFDLPSDRPLLGGYNYPDMMRNRIPEEYFSKFYKRMVYGYDTDGSKAVLTIDDNSHKTFEGMSKLKQRLENISWREDGSEDFESKEDEVKEQLRDLGYG